MDRSPGSSQPTDEQSLERYRYLLRTAPPEANEQAHEEAFAQLTPDQRRQALEALAREVPANEIRGDDPASLARTATRAELRQPGTIERAWGGGGGVGGGIGMGGWFMGTLAASFLGTAIAQSFFGPDLAGSADQSADAANETGSADGGDTSGDAGDAGDGGSWGDPGADAGGDSGGFGDLGGGDFGGF